MTADMKNERDTFRLETAIATRLEKEDLPQHGNYTVFRPGGHYLLSISNSVIAEGHQFTNKVLTGVATSHRLGLSLRLKQRPWIARDSEEGSLFIDNHLIRWYIDYYDGVTPSLYVTYDEDSSWWQRIRYRVRRTQKRREMRRHRHLRHA